MTGDYPKNGAPYDVTLNGYAFSLTVLNVILLNATTKTHSAKCQSVDCDFS
jgi:hypothetical protein